MLRSIPVVDTVTGSEINIVTEFLHIIAELNCHPCFSPRTVLRISTLSASPSKRVHYPTVKLQSERVQVGSMDYRNYELGQLEVLSI